MRRLGIPDPVIEQKLMLDGMDTGILRYAGSSCRSILRVMCKALV